MGNGATLRGKSERAERRIRLVAALVGIVLTVMAGWLALSRVGGSLRSLSYDIPFQDVFQHVPFLQPESDTADEVRIVYLEDIEGKDLGPEESGGASG